MTSDNQVSTGAVSESRRSVNAAALARAEQAWGLRVRGLPWAEVARVVGYADDTSACRAVRLAFGEVPVVERDELRRLWRDRMEHAWRVVLDDMEARRPGAVTAAVRVAAEAGRLDGLHEAERPYSPSAGELQAWVAARLDEQGITGGWPVEADVVVVGGEGDDGV